MSENTIRQKKIALRNHIRKILSAYTFEQKQMLDLKLKEHFRTIFAKMLAQSAKNTLTVLTYMPLSDEPDIGDLFALNANIIEILPISLAAGELRLKKREDKFQQGMYGIIEPDTASPEVLPEDIDYAIIPGRAFGKNGERLGRGKGYYDRLLARCNCPTIGLCYDAQVFADIPMSEHDKYLTYIITPTTVYT